MKKVNWNWKKGTAVLLAASLACGGIGAAVNHENQEMSSTGIGEACLREKETNLVAVEKEVPLSDKDKEKLAKEETVYVIANADGSTQKLIVSDWLKNALGTNEIQDFTELTDIENVKGEEGFKKKDGDICIWDAEGNDIYYRGSIEKELPVDMKISYKLNGEEISPEELAGKSGEVTIRFDYINRQKERVQVGDTTQELYVPFVVLTGMVLENENFSNIEVSNGKIVNDGERTAVLGYALPGLLENLDVDNENLDLPEYVEVTATTTDFELAATMTVVTNSFFSDVDTDAQGKMDELSQDMDELKDAMQELMDGTSDLYDGVLELYDGTGELTDGINDLNNGARDLRDGAATLYDGTKSLYDGAGVLKNGVGQLLTGGKTLSGKMTELNGGAKQVFEGLLTLANGQLAAIQAAAPGLQLPVLKADDPNLPGTIDELIQVLSQNVTSVQAAPEEEKLPEENQVPEVSDIPEEGDIPEEEKGLEKTDTQEQPAVTEKIEPVQETDIEEESAAQIQEKEITHVQAASGGTAQTQQNQMLQMTIGTLEALKGAYQVYMGTTAAAAGVDQLLAGVTTFSDGINTLYDGSEKVRDGAKELCDGTGKLKDGTHELKDGGQELCDGVTELRDGSLELRDGTREFHDEGIQKLVDIFEGDLQELTDRFEGTKSAAKAYRSFTGIADDMDGSVKFVYKTAAVER